jgi:hypothetical protein
LLGLRQVKLRRIGIFFPCYYYCSDHHEALRSAHSRLARWNHRGRSLLHVPVLFSPSADLVYSHEPFFIISLILLLCMFISLLGWQGLVYTGLVSILEKLDKVVVISVRFLLCDSGGLFLLFSPRRKLPNSAHVSRGGKTWGHVYKPNGLSIHRIWYMEPRIISFPCPSPNFGETITDRQGQNGRG